MHPQSTLPTSPRVCAFDGCARPHESRGYCAAHAAQLRTGRALAPILPRSESSRRNIQAALAARPNRQVKMACANCGRPFVHYAHERGRRFCSRACTYAFMRGPQGAGAAANRREAQVPWNKGRRAGDGRAASYHNRGMDGPIDRWRLSVYHRDGFTCQRCGDARGHNLQAHHIIPWAEDAELRFELFNGVTLCEICHKRLHARRTRCAVCGQPSLCRKLCRAHYLRWYRYGDPLRTKRGIKGTSP